jgi:hypothetical protein
MMTVTTTTKQTHQMGTIVPTNNVASVASVVSTSMKLNA